MLFWRFLGHWGGFGGRLSGCKWRCGGGGRNSVGLNRFRRFVNWGDKGKGEVGLGEIWGEIELFWVNWGWSKEVRL